MVTRHGVADAGRNTMQQKITDFLTQKKISVVGVSRNDRGFGRRVLENLKRRAYDVYGVNSFAEEGDELYPSLKDLPTNVDGVVCVVPPEQTESVVRECLELGIPRVWLQPGAESDTAVRFCEEHGIHAIHDTCIMLSST